MKYLPSITLILVFIALLGVCFASPTPESPKDVEAIDLSGMYEMQGIEDDTGYAGIVIINKVNSGYVLQFTFNIGNNQTAAGLVHNKTFSVGSSVRGFPQTRIYDIEGKNLDGRALTLPEGVRSTERLKYIGPFPSAKAPQ